MTLETTGPQNDLPFQRWRAAIAALAEAERRDPLSPAVDELANDVIAARLALTRARVTDGWTAGETATRTDLADTRLLNEGLGALSEVPPCSP